MIKKKRTLDLVAAVALALSLTACGGGSTTPNNPDTPGSPGDPDTTTPRPKEISGTVEGWTLGAAFVTAEGYGNDGAIVLAEGPISADGSFNLTLPVSGENLDKALYPYPHPDLCGRESNGSIEVTPSQFSLANVVSFSVYESADSSLDEAIGALALTSNDPSVHNRELEYVYASTAVSIQGECVSTYTETGGSSSYTIRYDLDYKPGWNEAQHITTGGTGSFVDAFVTAPFPADATWDYYSNVEP